MIKRLYLIIKRITDIFFSIGLLILLCPIFILIAILIKVQGDGSVIFTQKRLGKNSIPFNILKFRSMKNSAPNISAHMIDNECYVTKIGAFLRKTSLDETPQLINILKGEMSFVGPRPFIPSEGEIVELRKKHGVDSLRPGLTGLAQVEARETTDQDKKFKLDLYYLNNLSMMLDIRIVLRTFFSLRGK